MTAPHYATAAYVAWLSGQLSDRDAAIARDLARVRVLTGHQLDRLHFMALADLRRDTGRRRVMQRLVRLKVVTTLDRRIGGVRAGSAGFCYVLDVAGQRLVSLLDGHGVDARRPWSVSEAFLAHSLAVSEHYVQLRELEHQGVLELIDFRAEPASWQKTVSLGILKPDAYVLVARGDIEDAWWIEVDRGTESPNTLRRKLRLYQLIAQSGGVGPHDILPRVLITVPSERRYAVIEEVIDGLALGQSAFMRLCMTGRAAALIAHDLQE